jgi:hypothetical protein
LCGDTEVGVGVVEVACGALDVDQFEVCFDDGDWFAVRARYEITLSVEVGAIVW